MAAQSRPAAAGSVSATARQLLRVAGKLLAPTGDGPTTRSQRLAGVVIVGLCFSLFAVVTIPRRRTLAKGGGRGGTVVDPYGDLKVLLGILVPNASCYEARLLYSFVGILTVRTLLSIFVAHMEGRVIKSLVQVQISEFVRLSGSWLLMGLPAALCNALIKLLQSKLAFAFRNKLTKHFYDLYLQRDVYYKVGCLDDRIEHPDQMLTADCERFANQLADLISQLAKPIFDCFLFTGELWKSVGSGAVSGACLTTIGTAKILNALRPAFGRLTADIADCEGHWRVRHTRLTADSEEVAFHGGAEVERNRLEKAYHTLLNAHRKLMDKALPYNIFEGYLTKYLWSIVGMSVCAAPLLLSGKKIATGQATEILVTNRKLMASSADATERLMESLKEMAHITGRSGRLAQLHRVLTDVSDGNYMHKQVTNASGDSPSGKRSPANTRSEEIKYSGVVVHDPDMIRFENVPIVAPNAETLVKPVNFMLKRGQHCLIVGPNGCGKSSLFRVLAGLWPVFSGTLTRPEARKDIFFLPQRAYLVEGSLRDQIIYPHAKSEVTDAQLLEILEWARCRHVCEREMDGLDTVHEWKDVLSGGERQKIGLARVFYHRPKFAILDECTSQIHVDDEELLYSKVKDLGVTLMSVSHRRSIWHHHNHRISFENQEITFEPFDC